MKTCYDMSMFSVAANFLVMFTLYDRSLAVPLFAILCNIGGQTIWHHIFPKVYQSFERKKSNRLVDAPVSDEKVCVCDVFVIPRPAFLPPPIRLTSNYSTGEYQK